MLVTEGVKVNDDAQIINEEEEAVDEGRQSCEKLNGKSAEKEEEEMELMMKRSNGKHNHHEDAVNL